MLNLLLQVTVSPLASTNEKMYLIYLIITIISSAIAIIVGIVRYNQMHAKKIDRGEVEKLLNRKANRTDIDIFISEHAKEHADMNLYFNKQIEDHAKRQNEINESLFKKMDENTREQKEVNMAIIRKLDDIIPKLARIEANTEILMADYNSRP